MLSGRSNKGLEGRAHRGIFEKRVVGIYFGRRIRRCAMNCNVGSIDGLRRPPRSTPPFSEIGIII